MLFIVLTRIRNTEPGSLVNNANFVVCSSRIAGWKCVTYSQNSAQGPSNDDT